MWCYVVWSVGTDIGGGTCYFHPAMSMSTRKCVQVNSPYSCDWWVCWVVCLDTAVATEWSALAKAWSVMDPTLTAEWPVMIPMIWNWVFCCGPKTCNKPLLVWTLTHIRQFAGAQASRSLIPDTDLFVSCCTVLVNKQVEPWFDCQSSQSFISVFWLNYL